MALLAWWHGDIDMPIVSGNVAESPCAHERVYQHVTTAYILACA